MYITTKYVSTCNKRNCYQSHNTAPNTNVLSSKCCKTQRSRATCDTTQYRTVSVCVIVRAEEFIGVAVHWNTERVRLSLDLFQQTFIITSTEQRI
jgi:hypothetical protein